MSKKLWIPVLAFAVAAIGCAGGSSDTTGGAGMTGAGGSTAGAGGSTAGAGGSTAGGDGSTAGTGINSDPAGPDVVCTLETFCPIFLAYCGTTTPGYTTLDECKTTFAAVGAASSYKQQCQSQHLCISIYDTGDDRMLHCSHAAGGGSVCGF